MNDPICGFNNIFSTCSGYAHGECSLEKSLEICGMRSNNTLMLDTQSTPYGIKRLQNDFMNFHSEDRMTHRIV